MKDALQGSPLYRAYKEVGLIMQSPERGESVREARLRQILDYATAHIPYYKDRPYTRLADFPVVNKRIITGHYDLFQAPTNVIPGQKGPLHVQRTSGSTGTPFAIPQDTRCRIRRLATLKQENEYIGFHSFEPMMHLRALSHFYGTEKEIVVNKQLNIVYADNACLTDGKILRILQAMNGYRVKVVRGYMTTLDTLTRYAVEHGIELISRPTFISVGELLLDSLRQRIVDQLHCSVVSQYANEENGVFGHSERNKPGDRIVLNRANCFVEILKLDEDIPTDPGETGRIVVTDFTNYAMPLIRYDIGDLGVAGERRNGILMTIDKLCGRVTDLIYKTSGEAIDFWNSIPTDIYMNPDIIQWQFIQEEAATYRLVLSTRRPGTAEQTDHFRSELQDLLGNGATVHIDFVDDIPVLSSGKRKSVICKIKQ